MLNNWIFINKIISKIKRGKTIKIDTQIYISTVVWQAIILESFILHTYYCVCGNSDKKSRDGVSF